MKGSVGGQIKFYLKALMLFSYFLIV